MENSNYKELFERFKENKGLKLKRVSCLEQEVTHINGNIVNSETRRKYDFYKTNKDQFYMSFIEFMSPYFSLKGDLSKRLCILLCCMAEYDTGIVNISTYNRQEICNDLEISKSQLSRSFNELKDKGILREIGKGSYFINPLLFWKGDLLRRIDAIQDFYVEFVIVPKESKNSKLEKKDETIQGF